jgi:hypothetical protein
MRQWRRVPQRQAPASGLEPPEEFDVFEQDQIVQRPLSATIIIGWT